MKAGYVFLLALLLVAVPVPQAFAESITAGAAKQVFKLPSGVPLAGYSRRHGKPSTGQHDPVGVRALVVRGSQSSLAVVSCDLLIIDEQLFQAVQKQLPQLTLFIAATHTHSGPGAYGKKFAEKISMGHYDPRVFDAIVAAVVQAVEAADKASLPMRMACDEATTEGLAKNRVEGGGFADNQLVVCGIYAQESANPTAIIANFSAHPTTLGAWNKALSADYPGVVMSGLEQRFPSAVAFFFAGAVGDQAPVKSGEGFGRAEFIGRPLTRYAAGILARLAPASPGHFGFLQEILPLPPAKVRLNKHLALPRWFGQALVDDDASLSIAVIGQTAWFGVPCDLSSLLGRQLKEAARARGLFPVVVGFTNDYIGYCMPEPVYQTAEYEALMGFNGPKAGQLIVDRLIQMLGTLGK